MTDERFNEINGMFRLGMTVEQVALSKEELEEYQKTYARKFGDMFIPLSDKEVVNRKKLLAKKLSQTDIRSDEQKAIDTVYPKAGNDYDKDFEFVTCHEVKTKLDFCKLNDKKLKRLIEIGVLDDLNGINHTRDYNVGKSDYSKGEHLIQPWSLWLDWSHLTPWDHDIIKRVYRTKEEQAMTAEEARIMDYEKIIHDCKERIRQLRLKL